MVANDEDRLDELLLNRCLIDPKQGCWLWMGASDGHGYGVVRYQGRQVRLHRLAVWLYAGLALDRPVRVWHTCGRRRCFNPDHLVLCWRSGKIWRKRPLLKS